jgi:hypothetical protein
VATVVLVVAVELVAGTVVQVTHQVHHQVKAITVAQVTKHRHTVQAVAVVLALLVQTVTVLVQETAVLAQQAHIAVPR